MAKKKLILTKEQIERLSEGEGFSYLSDLASKPDMGNIYATEVTTDASVDGAYAGLTTAGDLADTMTCDWRGNAKLAGMGATQMRECTKREWTQKNIYNEEAEHGNKRLMNKNFGAGNGIEGRNYDSTKMAVSRKDKAEKELNSTDPQIRQQGANTLKKMYQNNPNLDLLKTQYEAAKVGDKIAQKNKQPGTKIKSAPKQTGNGKAHSPKNGGVFLN
jgi:hypothetical protein